MVAEEFEEVLREAWETEEQLTMEKQMKVLYTVTVESRNHIEKGQGVHKV